MIAEIDAEHRTRGRREQQDQGAGEDQVREHDHRECTEIGRERERPDARGVDPGHEDGQHQRRARPRDRSSATRPRRRCNGRAGRSRVLIGLEKNSSEVPISKSRSRVPPTKAPAMNRPSTVKISIHCTITSGALRCTLPMAPPSCDRVGARDREGEQREHARCRSTAAACASW